MELRPDGAIPVQSRECRQEGLGFLQNQILKDPSAADPIIKRAEQLSGAAVVQILRPGDRLPFIFKSDRLIIQLDDQGRVGRYWCG